MGFFKKLTILNLLFGCLAFGLASQLKAAPLIRVKLFLRSPNIRVSCAKGLKLKLPDGKNVYSGYSVIFTPNSNGLITLNGRYFLGSNAVLVYSSGPFTLNNQRYRGFLEIQNNDGRLEAINFINIEEYLYSVIGAEMPAFWPAEALRAQAVAARTYALKKGQERENLPFDVVSTYADQAYNGISSETSQTRQATKETQGQVLTYHGSLIMAYYHADCGGITEKGSNVFEGYLPYLQSVVCPYGNNSSYHNWRRTFPLRELSRYLGIPVQKIAISKDPQSRRVVNVRLETPDGERIIPGFSFRNLLGTRNLRSTEFDLQEVYIMRIGSSPGEKIFLNRGWGLKADPLNLNFGIRWLNQDENQVGLTVPYAVTFLGHGWGHGVGLCQWGARGMASLGKSYKDILHYYYHDVELRQIYYAASEMPRALARGHKRASSPAPLSCFSAPTVPKGFGSRKALGLDPGIVSRKWRGY